MHYHILGLFPESLSSYFEASLLHKAQEKGLLKISLHQLRDWGLGRSKHVDDKPYGGGSGMVFLPEVVCQAVRDLKKAHGIEHVILVSPRGEKLSPSKAKNLSQKKSILFLCGRYEGIDERAIDLVMDEEISVGDYVLSGGELAAVVIIDVVSRYVPGVVGQGDSVENDSFEKGLLEHPHYTRPEIFEGKSVPKVLLSGNHQEVAKWRAEQSLVVTQKKRPDLLKN